MWLIDARSLKRVQVCSWDNYSEHKRLNERNSSSIYWDLLLCLCFIKPSANKSLYLLHRSKIDKMEVLNS